MERRPHHSGDGDGWAVDPAHVQPLQDYLVEGSVHAPGQEPVQLKAATRGRTVHYHHTHTAVPSLLSLAAGFTLPPLGYSAHLDQQPEVRVLGDWVPSNGLLPLVVDVYSLEMADRETKPSLATPTPQRAACCRAAGRSAQIHSPLSLLFTWEGHMDQRDGDHCACAK